MLRGTARGVEGTRDCFSTAEKPPEVAMASDKPGATKGEVEQFEAAPVQELKPSVPPKATSSTGHEAQSAQPPKVTVQEAETDQQKEAEQAELEELIEISRRLHEALASDEGV